MKPWIGSNKVYRGSTEESVSGRSGNNPLNWRNKKIMADYEALKSRVQQLATRDWDVPTLKARIQKLTADGIPRKTLNRDKMLVNKPHILDRVQQRAEEYNFILNGSRGRRGAYGSFRGGQRV